MAGTSRSHVDTLALELVATFSMSFVEAVPPGTLSISLRLWIRRYDFDTAVPCIYTSYMRFIWDEAKRRAHLRDHEIDFVDAERVFGGLTATFEDDRFSYDERRFVTLELPDGVPVSIVHTESDEDIRVISFR